VSARGAAVAAAMLAGALGTGCSSGTTVEAGSSTVRIYVSAPLRGAAAAEGRDVEDGARLALSQAGGKVGGLAVRGVYLDDTAPGPDGVRWSAARVGENARRATQDTSAIAYIGDFDSGATRTSEPITNEAELLQVSPASTAVDLTRPFIGSQELPDIEQNSNERTFGRVIPDDEAQAQAAAHVTETLGVKSVLILLAEGAYAKTVADAYRAALRGVTVVKHAAAARFYPGVGAPSISVAGGIKARLPVPETTIATDGVLPPWAPPSAARGIDDVTAAAQAPSQLPPAGRRFIASFNRRFHRAPGPYAAYGFESMALVLDSIKRAGNQGDSRQAVIDQFFDTTDRNSILGDYSIDSVGDTTLNRLGSYAARGGRLAPAPHAIPAR
jgi:branched-chain amino acid transport system substrate-binding protein